MSHITAVNEAMLEIAVNAVGGGHELGGFELTERNGFQAECRRCGMTAWVGVDGVMYSLLGDSCGG